MLYTYRSDTIFDIPTIVPICWMILAIMLMLFLLHRTLAATQAATSGDPPENPKQSHAERPCSCASSDEGTPAAEEGERTPKCSYRPSPQSVCSVQASLFPRERDGS